MVRGQRVGAIYAIRPLADMQSTLDELLENLVKAGFLAVGVAALLSFALAFFLIRPVRKLAEAWRESQAATTPTGSAGGAETSWDNWAEISTRWPNGWPIIGTF